MTTQSKGLPIKVTLAGLTRSTLLLALLGAWLSIHIWIQKERGFDSGCWGLAGISGAQKGCDSSALKKFGQMLGLPLPVWGYMFFTTCAGLSMAQMFSCKHAKLLHELSRLLVLSALLVTVYLVYVQFVLLKSVCPLCMMSAMTVIAIAALYFWSRRISKEPNRQDERNTEEVSYLARVGVLSALLGPGLLVFVEKMGTYNIDRQLAPRDMEGFLFAALPKFIDEDTLRRLAPADPARRITPSEWVNATYPRLGRGKDVSVIVFLDPNCPSCSDTFDKVKKLAERLEDKASFYIISRVLWDHSILPTQALELAKTDRQYFELWRRLFAIRSPHGFTEKAIGNELSKLGIVTGNLADRLQSVLPLVTQQRASAVKAKITSVPSFFINGTPSSGINNNIKGVEYLIIQALAGDGAVAKSAGE